MAIVSLSFFTDCQNDNWNDCTSRKTDVAHCELASIDFPFEMSKATKTRGNAIFPTQGCQTVTESRCLWLWLPLIPLQWPTLRGISKTWPASADDSICQVVPVLSNSTWHQICWWYQRCCLVMMTLQVHRHSAPNWKWHSFLLPVQDDVCPRHVGEVCRDGGRGSFSFRFQMNTSRSSFMCSSSSPSSSKNLGLSRQWICSSAHWAK